MRLRAHGLTCLFWAGLAAWAIVAHASFELTGFEDRIVSGATLHAVDIAARTRLYAVALAAFVAVAAAVALVLTGVAKIVGDDVLADLEDASLGGLVVLALAGVTSVEGDAVALCAWLEGAYLACAVLDARLFRATVHPRPGSAFLLVSASAYGLVCASPWRTSAPVVAAVAVALHLGLQGFARAGQTQRVDRLLAGLAPFALVPLALVAREEITLFANHRGIAFVDSTASAAIVAVLLVLFALVRARRADVSGRIDVARLVARTSLPCLLLGFSTLTFWAAVRTPPGEMLEAGNAGLSIQQFIEYGRLPFFDTFDVHGLSDSLMGFLYAGVNGWNGTTWQHWDFVQFTLATLGVYAVMARVLGSAPYAFLAVVVSPFVRELFPSAFGIALGFVFVLVACLHARRAVSFGWLVLALAAVWLWRMDMGFACTVAGAVVFGVRMFGERSEPIPWRRALLGSAVCAGALIVIAGLVALARGVDAVARLQELSRVVASDQAFGAPQLADRVDEVVSFRLFVMPVLVVAIGALLALRLRASKGSDVRWMWPNYALVFLAAFSLVVFTRGLVRHTFVEHVGAYVTGYGFALVALAPSVFLAPGRTRLSFGCFVALHALLPLAFEVDKRNPAQIEALQSNVLARASYRLRGWKPVAPVAGQVFERSPVSAEFRARNIEPLRALTQRWLAPGETFLDLSASPMLYVYAGARSPHWLNHVITAQGDVLQRHFLSELEGARAPLVVMRQDAALAAQDGMQAILDIDGVPLALWQARIFDALHAQCEPFEMAGRYEVWARTDWAPAAAPSEGSTSLGSIAVGAPTGETMFEARPGESLMLVAVGHSSAAAVLHVTARIEMEGFEDAVSRDIAWPPGAMQRCIPFAGDGLGLRLSRVEVRASGGLECGGIEMRRVREPALAEAAAHAALPVDSELGPTAYLWGRYDRGARTTEQWLHETSAPAIDIADAAHLRFPFTPPSRARRSVLVVCTLASDAASRTQAVVRYGVGDRVGGSYRFDVLPGAAPSTYVFRPGFQANWHRRPNAWLEIEAHGAALHVHSIALEREP